MRYDQMPNDRLKGLGVWRHRVGGRGRDDHHRVGHLRGIPAIAADHPDDARPNTLGELQGLDDVGADVLFEITSADRKDEHDVACPQSASLEPPRERGFPAVIIDSRGELRDIVGRGVALDAGDLAEVIDRVSGVPRATADPENKQPPALVAHRAQDLDDPVYRSLVDTGRDLRRFAEISRGVVIDAHSNTWGLEGLDLAATAS